MRCLLELPRGACGRLAYPVYGYLGCSERSARLAFNGQFLDGAMRGYFLGNGHRVYSPVLMRFNSPDTLSPFGSGGINAYAYCGGDPVNFSDPDGQTRFSNNPSVFDPIFASIRKKNYRVQGFSYNPKAPSGGRISRFRAKDIDGVPLEREDPTVSTSGWFYVNKDRTLFVRDVLVPTEGIEMKSLEAFASEFIKAGFTLMKVNPTHARISGNGQVVYDSDVILISESTMTDFSKQDLSMPGLGAAIRKGRKKFRSFFE